MKDPVRHVVLLTYGEPPEASFGSQLEYSWRIVLGLTRSVASIPAVLLPLIALRRARLRVRLWTDERYSSPLEPITRAQAAGLERALHAQAPGAGWRVHVAYEFRDPLLPALLDSLPAGEPVDVLPMYVTDSAFTHEISRQTLARWSRTRAGRRRAPVNVLSGLDPERFADVAARHLLRELGARGVGGHDWALVLAAHGTLLEPRRPIETGRVATEAVAAAIAERCVGRFGAIQLGWLNHVYGGRWTEPPAEEALRRLAEQGYRRVAYFPFGFCADNAESQLEGRLALRTQPGLESVLLPCLNDAPEYMAALAASVIGAAEAQTPEGVGAGRAARAMG